MKAIIFSLTLITASGWASPPPDEQQQQQQQQDQQGQCRRNCPPPGGYICHARMLDCYNRPLYTYWGRGPAYQGACHVAMSLCQRDAAFGYGGYGARCILLGK